MCNIIFDSCYYNETRDGARDPRVRVIKYLCSRGKVRANIIKPMFNLKRIILFGLVFDLVNKLFGTHHKIKTKPKNTLFYVHVYMYEEGGNKQHIYTSQTNILNMCDVYFSRPVSRVVKFPRKQKNQNFFNVG